ncbi:MAG: hypothetical protein ACI8TP_005298 [Acidimicrobiales bacterium]|jgi:uncharacterized protein YjbI with pentapeptide repeats
MPTIGPDDAYAKAPQVPKKPKTSPWTGRLEVDRSWAELVDVLASGAVRAADCAELEISGCELDRVELDLADIHRIKLLRSSVSGSDLSGLTLSSMRGCHLSDTKLVGSDFSDGTLTDLVFERCSFRLANLRAATLERVSFVDCVLDDVDLFEAQLTDVTVVGSSLNKTSVDRVRAERVDLRGATTLEPVGIGRLDGCLIDRGQAIGLAAQLAQAVGLAVSND